MINEAECKVHKLVLALESLPELDNAEFEQVLKYNEKILKKIEELMP